MLSAGACSPQTSKVNRTIAPVILGQPALIENFPWQVYITNDSIACGGAIIAANIILTANHCAEDFERTPEQTEVVAGEADINNIFSVTRQSRKVQAIVRYPGYVDVFSGGDLALLLLDRPLTTTDQVSPIALVTQEDADRGLDRVGTQTTITGWGWTSSAFEVSNTLQKVTLPIVSNADATTAYRDLPEFSSAWAVTNDQLAAGGLDQSGQNTCKGDSGGPAVRPHRQNLQLQKFRLGRGHDPR